MPQGSREFLYMYTMLPPWFTHVPSALLQGGLTHYLCVMLYHYYCVFPYLLLPSAMCLVLGALLWVGEVSFFLSCIILLCFGLEVTSVEK